MYSQQHLIHLFFYHLLVHVYRETWVHGRVHHKTCPPNPLAHLITIVSVFRAATLALTLALAFLADLAVFSRALVLVLVPHVFFLSLSQPSFKMRFVSH
jgi:hypothetical protein